MNKQTARPVVKQMGTLSARMWGAVFCGIVFAALAFLYRGEVVAAPANQTIPPRTPQATATNVPTVTPTAQQPTATPIPENPTATSQPGAPTATQTATPLPQPTATPVPAFSLQGQMAVVSGVALQGGEVEIRITIVNPGTEAAQNVAVRDEVPAVLQIVSVSAEGGTASTETGTNGNSIALFAWPSLAPGGQAHATLVVRIAPNLANGTVIDNLAVGYADNAGAVTIGVTLGTPPVLLPTFE